MKKFYFLYFAEIPLFNFFFVLNFLLIVEIFLVCMNKILLYLRLKL